jgi:hypothetical protein
VSIGGGDLLTEIKYFSDLCFDISEMITCHLALQAATIACYNDEHGENDRYD